MSKNNSKKESSENNISSYYGGMTFKEFKNAGKFSLNLSDAVWAGRLFYKFPILFKNLNRGIVIMMSISILCLAVIWGSIFMRTAPLLLGVYPNGQIVCFPRLINTQGQAVSLDKSYKNLCKSLDDRDGMKWQNNNKNAISNILAIRQGTPIVKFLTADEILASHPSINYTSNKTTGTPQ